MKRFTLRDYLIDALWRPQRILARNDEATALMSAIYKLVTEDRIFAPLALTFTEHHIIVFNSRRSFDNDAR